MTTRDLERLLELLGRLYEDPTMSGEMRDEISHVRSECYRLLGEE